MASASVAAAVAAPLQQPHRPDQIAPGPDGEVDQVALQMQISEVSSALDAVVAERLALQLAYEEGALGWQQGDAGSQGVSLMEEEEAVLRSQLQQLQAQAGLLQAQDEHAATEAYLQQQRQDLRLARQVADSEHIAHHDHRFAQRLALMDDAEWERVGDLAEAPLHPHLANKRRRSRSPVRSPRAAPGSSQRPPGVPCSTGGAASTSAAGVGHGQGEGDVVLVDLVGPSAGTSTGVGSHETPAAAAAATPEGVLPQEGSALAAEGGEVVGPATGEARRGEQAGGKGKEAVEVVDMTQDEKLWDSVSQQRRCKICLEDHALCGMLCANRPTDRPSSSSTRDAGCGHYFCQDCMQQYARNRVQARHYPVVCPEDGCGGLLDHRHLDSLLEDSPDDLRALQEVETIHALGPAEILYCPHKGCSALLARADAMVPNEPTHCPVCRGIFCPTCRIKDWHQGMTCEAFQALPAHQRSAEDAAVLQLSTDKRWKACPRCQMVVERSYGCNHMRCRCGADFCYACGKQYLNNQPNVNNVHGTPDCRCNLFDVPPEPAPPVAVLPLPPPAPPAPAPAAPPALAVPGRQAPFGQGNPQAGLQEAGRRGGNRFHRRHNTRCRRAESILDCPHGDRCWFTHVEDL